MLLTESAEIFRTLSYPGRLTGTEVFKFYCRRQRLYRLTKIQVITNVFTVIRE